MDFKQRLFELFNQRGITNSDLAKATGISTARISNFYNGVDMPSLDNALKIAEYFKCTFDYLFGLTDKFELVIGKREFSTDKFLNRLNEILNERNMSQRKLCSEAELNKACISNWRHGQKPKTRNLIKIANVTNSSIDYLLGFDY